MNDLHRLAVKQLAKSTRPDGSVDVQALMRQVSAAYADFDADRRRTDRSIVLMVDELQQFNGQLERAVAERTAEIESMRLTMQVAMDNVHHGIMMIDDQRRLVVFNRRAIELLGLPEEAAANPEAFRKTFAQRVAAGKLGGADPAFVEWMLGGTSCAVRAEYERTRENGKTLKVTHTPLPDGGCVRTFTDITRRIVRETARGLAEQEYRDLFENAVFGIYRASVDGRLLRANPALVRLHGYACEADMVGADTDVFEDLFVDPQQCGEFKRQLVTHGRVMDFVAQIYRHRSRERIWIAQNAWAVRDAGGAILFFEGTVLDSNERKQSEAKIAHLAHHDVMTNLPNRAMFHKELGETIDRAARGQPAALHFLDLDGFKEVNDALGHLAGDRLLKEVARRLRSCVRDADIVARLGGDEFAIIQRAMDGPQDAAALADRVLDAMAKPFRLGRQRAKVAASVGIVRLPKDGLVQNDLIRNADLALYRAKGDGGGRYRLFDSAMFLDLTRRRALEIDLRDAIKRGELSIHYQPIVELATNTTIGFEALLRWTHPRFGAVSPAEFIPVAEDTGAIVPIGEWVLREACKWICEVSDTLFIAVNVSAVQFHRSNITQRALHVLAATGLDQSRLTLEITESAFLTDDQATVAALNALRKLGVQISLDDFGTGYSSLSYVQKFPFDVIKIDRTFTSRIDCDKVNSAAVRAIIALGRDLGISIVAEGVETEEERMALIALGCDKAQGYLFGRPLPAAAYPASQKRFAALA